MLLLIQHEYMIKYHVSNFESMTDIARLSWLPHSNHSKSIVFSNIQYMVDDKVNSRLVSTIDTTDTYHCEVYVENRSEEYCLNGKQKTNQHKINYHF